MASSVLLYAFYVRRNFHRLEWILARDTYNKARKQQEIPVCHRLFHIVEQEDMDIANRVDPLPAMKDPNYDSPYNK